jgi:regulator of protease activity HflC (stomatin/prohibitin superfamily)
MMPKHLSIYNVLRAKVSDGILFLKVVDAAAATNNIKDYRLSVIQLAMTSMRNAIGSLELDECFQNRDAINAKYSRL